MIISANRYHRIASIGTIRTCSDLLHWHKFNRPIFVSKSDWPNMSNRELEMSKLKKHFRCLRHRPRKGKSAICNPWLKVRFFGLTRKTSFRNCRLKPWVHQSTLYSSIGWKQSHCLSLINVESNNVIKDGKPTSPNDVRPSRVGTKTKEPCGPTSNGRSETQDSSSSSCGSCTAY